MSISRLWRHFLLPQRYSFYRQTLFTRGYCSSAMEYLTPSEIGHLSFKLEDKRISKLLSRFRAQHEDAMAKKINLQSDYLDFFRRISNVENRIAEVDRQIDELRRNFPDVQNPVDGSSAIDPALEIGTTDSELAKMVEEDRLALITDRQRFENSLLSELAVWLLRNDFDSKNIPTDLIMEMSAGVGGQEAMLFTRDIFEMYRRYAQYRQWKFDILEEQTTDLNGLHFASAAISGPDAYSKFRFEGGVHRVQRVPATEKTGRVHTSTMSVAILGQPSLDNEEVKVNMKEFRFDTFRCGGPGGQNVNKNDTGSRVTHIPTGISVTCQMERHAHINRDWALRRVLAVLYDRRTDSQRELVERSRKLQVGSLARSEKIRTYNYQQDRVTDHRTKQNFAGIPETLAGGQELDGIISSMQRFHLEERLSEILDQEEKSSSQTQEDTLRKTG